MLLVAAILALDACGRASTTVPPTPAADDTVVVQGGGDETAVSLKPGQTLVLELKVNASTGFDWTLEAPPAANLLSGGGFLDTYLAFGKPGDGGARRYTYKAVKPGKTDLKFNDTRGDPEPAYDQHAVFHVTISQ